MSCDNIIDNGAVTRTATLGAAAAIGPDPSNGSTQSISFPNSMVDRITPATTDTDRSWLADNYGLTDRWPVVTEPFRQWVVEDNFGGAPTSARGARRDRHLRRRAVRADEAAAAQRRTFVSRLPGRTRRTSPPSTRRWPTEYLHRFVDGFLDHEAKPALPPVAGVDLDAYTASVVERFSNPQIGDQIERLCLDGSAKFPKFLLPTVRDQLAAGGPVALSALALAGWCEYLNGVTAAGVTITHASDPLLDVAIEHARRSQTDPAAFLDSAAGVRLRSVERSLRRCVRHGHSTCCDRRGYERRSTTTLQEVAGANVRPND